MTRRMERKKDYSKSSLIQGKNPDYDICLPLQLSILYLLQKLVSSLEVPADLLIT